MRTDFKRRLAAIEKKVLNQACTNFEMSDLDYCLCYATKEQLHNFRKRIERRLAEEKRVFEKATISIFIVDKNK